MSALAYKPHAADAIAGLRDLYERRAGDRIFATMEVPSAALADFQRRRTAAECAYPDPEERAAFWDALLRERAAVEDDAMPCAYLSEFDQGLYGGLLGGDVRFLCHPQSGWISSMVPPLLKDWSEFDGLKLDRTHAWWTRYLHQLDVFIERGRGKWGISHFILIDALNFVFELFGATAAYLSVEERPDDVRRAIDFAFDLNVAVQEAFFGRVGLCLGGTLSNFGQWIPGRIVSESLDPYHMTSVVYFERWGREPAERILRRFDGGVIHIHGNGRHLLAAASRLENLKAILLLDDLRFAKAFDVLDQLKAVVGDVPLSLLAPCAAFVERLRRRELPGGVLYQVQGVPDVDAANRLMAEVRAYRV
jgi:hypothetical protein